MSIVREELDELDLSGLADKLAQVRTTRTELGWGTDNAVTKTSLERRIMERVCQPGGVDASRVTCGHQISLESKRKTIESEVAEIRPGGLVIPRAGGLRDGESAILKIRTENNYPLKVKCVVREMDGVEDGVAVAFEQLDGGAERRVERLIMELLKSQLTD